jgi:long-subunit acyl-CoA synthetase (AMP-forming)
MLLTKIQKIAQRYPDAVAVQMKAAEGYLRLTYQDLLRQVASLAASLKELGIEKGDRVAVLSENRPEWMVAYLTVVAAGGVIVPLDAQLAEKEVELLLASAEAKAVFVSAACRGKLPRGSSITIVSFDPGAGRLFTDVLKAIPEDESPLRPPFSKGDGGEIFV